MTDNCERLYCETCGRIGSIDDGIEDGGPCQEPCDGIVKRLDATNTFSRWEQFEALEAYIKCALWSSVHYADEDSEGVPFDDVDAELSEEAIQTMSADLFPFMLDNAADLDCMPLGQIGHDFWLTRNHHGAGFWDRDLGDAGARLTAAAHVYGSSELYLGDDGLIYVA